MTDWACPDGELVLTVDQGKDRERWLAERRKGIGGSEVAALMGDSRYATAFEVWLDKTGRTPDREASLPMEMGSRFEAAVAEKFADDTGMEIRRRGMLRSKIEPLCLANVDRLSSDGFVVEIKVVNGFMKMPPEDDGDDPFCGWPKAWFWQGVQNTLVSGRKGCHLVVAIGNSAFVHRTLYRDDERVRVAIENIREAVPAWWTKHIVEGEIPEMGLPDVPAMDTVPEGSKWEAFIPEQLLSWRDELRELRSTKKELGEREDELKAKIDAESGGAQWLLADGVPVLQFSPRKGRASFKKAQLFACQPVNGRTLAADAGYTNVEEWLASITENDEDPKDPASYLLTEASFTGRGAPSRSLLIVGKSDDEKED